MQDFPPRIATFFTGTDDAPTPDPDTRSPAAFLRWMLRQQWQVIALSTLACLLWLLPLTFGPYIFGKAVDDGILAGSTSDLLKWSGVMLAVVVRRRRLRRRLPHPDRAQLADQPLRHDPDGHPQDRPDGPRAAASLADRRGAQRRVERLRRVRCADRDPGALRRTVRLLPHRRRDRAVDVVAARRARAGRRSGPARRRAAAAAAAAPAPAGRAQPQLRADLDGHRHRGRAAHPARHRRRGHLRPQLRRPVAVGPQGRRLVGHLAGRRRGGRRAVLRRLPGEPGLARHPAGQRRRAQRRPAGELPGLRPLHGRADPHVLRARPEVHARAGQRAQGDRDLRAAPTVARAGRSRSRSTAPPRSSTTSAASPPTPAS